MQLTIAVVHDSGTVDGGSSRYALSSARGMAAQGWRVIFFSGTPPDPATPPLPTLTHIWTGQPDLLSDPQPWRAALRACWNPTATRRLAQVLDGLDPTRSVIHVHGWHRVISAFPIRLAARRGFKVALTIHEYFWACPNGGFYHYPREEVCRLRALSLACLRENCDKRHYIHKLWRFSRALCDRWPGRLPQSVDAFIFNSPFSQRILAPYLPASVPCHLVPPPLDLPRRGPVNAAAHRRLLYVGRLSPDKGVELLARAAQSLSWEITFVGDGPLRDKILSLCPGAEITGWLNREGVLRYLRRARALVFPSVWYETFGLAVAEALSQGVPVVVADGCAARDLVTDGIDGLWFRQGEVTDLAAKLARLRDDALVAHLSRQAYENFWARPLTVESHVRKMEAVYESLLT